MLALAADRPPAPLAPSVDERDPCWVLYTGGTSGRPKGVVLSHRAFATMALTTLAEWEVPGEARYLAASPITHAAGTLVVPVLLRGGTVHITLEQQPRCHALHHSKSFGEPFGLAPLRSQGRAHDHRATNDKTPPAQATLEPG